MILQRESGPCSVSKINLWGIHRKPVDFTSFVFQSNTGLNLKHCWSPSKDIKTKKSIYIPKLWPHEQAYETTRHVCWKFQISNMIVSCIDSVCQLPIGIKAFRQSLKRNFSSNSLISLRQRFNLKNYWRASYEVSAWRYIYLVHLYLYLLLISEKILNPRHRVWYKDVHKGVVRNYTPLKAVGCNSSSTQSLRRFSLMVTYPMSFSNGTHYHLETTKFTVCMAYNLLKVITPARHNYYFATIISLLSPFRCYSFQK